MDRMLWEFLALAIAFTALAVGTSFNKSNRPGTAFAFATAGVISLWLFAQEACRLCKPDNEYFVLAIFTIGLGMWIRVTAESLRIARTARLQPPQ